MSQIVVTGGGGFIGSHLCEALLRRGDHVTALDSFDDFYDPTVKRRNIATVLAHARFKLVEGDIRDATVVDEVISERTDVVVHLAARAGVRPSISRPLLYQDVNVRGTMILLEACRKQPNCRFIFASSSSVYGNNKKIPFAEEDNVDHPISPYAATKRAGELLSYTYHHLYGTSITVLRLFTVYGPRQRPDLAIHKFARLIEAGEPIPIFGDGDMTRDFTYIDDTVDGIVRAIERCKGYHVFNLGESRPVSVSDLIAALEEALGKKAVIEVQDRQPGDVDRTWADLTSARCELGYAPSTDLRTGLARFVEWLHGEAAGR